MTIVSPGTAQAPSEARRSHTQTLGVTAFAASVMQATADAQGDADVMMPPVATGMIRMVQRITVAVEDTAASPQARVYSSDVDLRHLLDGTPAGHLDVAEYDPPVLLREGEQLRVAWVNCDPGDVCVARVQYADAIPLRGDS